jgi:hypothetical protein
MSENRTGKTDSVDWATTITRVAVAGFGLWMMWKDFKSNVRSPPQPIRRASPAVGASQVETSPYDEQSKLGSKGNRLNFKASKISLNQQQSQEEQLENDKWREARLEQQRRIDDEIERQRLLEQQRRRDDDIERQRLHDFYVRQQIEQQRLHDDAVRRQIYEQQIRRQ